MALVYVVVRRDTGDSYVGRTTQTFEARRRRHLYDAKKGCQYHFHRALRLYGMDAFDWFIESDELTFDEAKRQERFLVAAFVFGGINLYNMTRGGEGFKGRRHSEATKELLRRKLSGVNNPMYGKPCVHTIETRRKISEMTRGKKKNHELPELPVPLLRRGEGIRA